MRSALVLTLLVAWSDTADAKRIDGGPCDWASETETLAFLPLILVGILLGYLVRCAFRHTTRTGDPLALHVADDIARITLFYARGLITAYSAAFVAAVVQGAELIAISVALLAVFELGTLIGAIRVRRALTAERAYAELRGTLLIVRSACGQARVHAAKRVIAASQTPTLPTSVVR